MTLSSALVEPPTAEFALNQARIWRGWLDGRQWRAILERDRHVSARFHGFTEHVALGLPVSRLGCLDRLVFGSLAPTTRTALSAACTLVFLEKLLRFGAFQSLRGHVERLALLREHLGTDALVLLQGREIESASAVAALLHFLTAVGVLVLV